MLLLKRSRRHTVGILVSTFPCGIITVFEELFGSESLTQVYAIMVEYFAKLPSPSREKILEIVYDDACHFKKFSENIDRASKNEISSTFLTMWMPGAISIAIHQMLSTLME